MQEVTDLKGYVQKMEKSLLDKMFFMDKMFDPVENILDFGCANGVLIRALSYLFPEHNYVGYDISDEMIALSRKMAPDASFYKNWDEIPIEPQNTVLNISSTLHEVYSYGTEESIDEFWHRVFHSGFKYIAIRDMMLSDGIKLMSDESDIRKVRNLRPERLREYESIWGPISIRFNMIHYLLKYRYNENWDREVRENYLPITVESLLEKIPSNYEIIYMEHYTLPFVKQQVKKDCGVILRDATHFKLLLKISDQEIVHDKQTGGSI